MRPENSEYEKRLAKYFLILNLKKTTYQILNK